MKIHIDCDTRQVTKELHRLMVAPDMKTVVNFNAIFAAVTGEVDAMIHVETVSLKSTAKWDSSPYPAGWQGTVHVGGAAPGMPRDPAFYGVYELHRGGSHFFFAPAYADVPSKIIDAILAFYSGGEGKMAIKDFTPSPGGSSRTAIKTGSKAADNAASHAAGLARAKHSGKSSSHSSSKEEPKSHKPASSTEDFLADMDKRIKAQHAKEFPDTVGPRRRTSKGPSGHSASEGHYGMGGGLYTPSSSTPQRRIGSSSHDHSGESVTFSSMEERAKIKEAQETAAKSGRHSGRIYKSTKKTFYFG